MLRFRVCREQSDGPTSGRVLFSYVEVVEPANTGYSVRFERWLKNPDLIRLICDIYYLSVYSCAKEKSMRVYWYVEKIVVRERHDSNVYSKANTVMAARRTRLATINRIKTKYSDKKKKKLIFLF